MNGKNTCSDDRLFSPVLHKNTPEREAEIRAEDERERQRLENERNERIRKLKLDLIHDARLLDCTFANDNGSNPGITKFSKAYAEHIAEMKKNKYGIMFYGNVGTGKSYYAAAIVNKLWETASCGIMISTIPILAGYQFDNNNKWKWEYALKCSVLVIDDFGIERDTDYLNECKYTIINARYGLENAVTIITTNMSKEYFENPKGIEQDRIFSRIRKLCTNKIEVTGSDQRINKDDEKKALKILIGGND